MPRAGRARRAPAPSTRSGHSRPKRSPAIRTASTSRAARSCWRAMIVSRSKLATRTPRYGIATARRSATSRWNAARTVCRETPYRAAAASSRNGASAAKRAGQDLGAHGIGDAIDRRRRLARSRGACRVERRHRGIRPDRYLPSTTARTTSQTVTPTTATTATAAATAATGCSSASRRNLTLASAVLRLTCFGTLSLSSSASSVPANRARARSEFDLRLEAREVALARLGVALADLAAGVSRGHTRPFPSPCRGPCGGSRSIRAARCRA